MPEELEKKTETKKFKLYAYPKFKCRYGDYYVFRLTGSGLGNNLFVWAKYKIFAKKYGAELISPTWIQLNITKNRYFLEHLRRHNLGLFRKGEKNVTGLKKLIIMFFKPKVDRELFEKLLTKDPNSIEKFKNHVVLVSGMNDYFEYILSEHDFIKTELLSIVRDKHKKALNFDFGNSISVHVRLGDFNQTLDDKEIGANNMRLGISWYIQLIHDIRAEVGRAIKVYVFSDGTNDELSELLNLDQVERLSFGSSVGDLIGLTQSNLLITSGSTYSMWASYLGRMPVIWYQGKLKQRIYYRNPTYEIECNKDNILDRADLNLISNYLSNGKTKNSTLG